MSKSRRLIVSGFPCSKEVWEKFFCDGIQQRVIPLVEVIQKTASADPRVWSKYISAQIEEYAPTSIVCHDVGVTLTLLALIRLQRRNTLKCLPRVTIFNGAFRGFNVLKAKHPLLIQIKGADAIASQVREAGGVLDPKIKSFFPLVKRFYLYVIANSFFELVSLRILRKTQPKINLRLPLQLIASGNDPYIPNCALQALQRDFSFSNVHQINYGHFPYSQKNSKILEIVQRFEG